MTRIFDAPRELVFNAYTDPALIARWWGRRAHTTVVDKMQVRPGGQWRYVERGADGENGFRGEYREVVPPERLVSTFEWEGLPGHVALVTNVFEELGGKTKLTETSLFTSTEDRDGMLQSGMETGANESMERLDELLDELRV
jgi:uncharacterized protein YndB with AHSA1/START domain